MRLDLGGGLHAPEGVEVTANPRMTQRDRAVYGPDADAFRPERWLEGEARVREYARLSMAFGYGSRACLGQHVAWVEPCKAPLPFFKTFGVKLQDPGRPGKYLVKGGIAFYEDMWVEIERREPAVRA